MAVGYIVDVLITTDIVCSWSTKNFNMHIGYLTSSTRGQYPKGWLSIIFVLIDDASILTIYAFWAIKTMPAFIDNRNSSFGVKNIIAHEKFSWCPVVVERFAQNAWWNIRRHGEEDTERNAGLAERSGCGLQLRLSWFDSNTLLHGNPAGEDHGTLSSRMGVGSCKP